MSSSSKSKCVHNPAVFQQFHSSLFTKSSEIKLPLCSTPSLWLRVNAKDLQCPGMLCVIWFLPLKSYLQLYSVLNTASKLQPQSLAILRSFVWNALFILFFSLPPSSDLCSDVIFSLAYVIILCRISNHPPSISTQIFSIS